MDPIDGYVLDMKRRGLAENTLKTRERCLRLFARDGGFQRNREQIEAWLDGRRLSAKSRSVWLSHLGCFFAWQVESGLIASSPTAGIRPPKLRRNLPRPIPDAELARALAKASPLHRLWLLLGRLEGLRACEIAGLTRDDLSESEGLLRVVEAKGGHERVVPLHPQVLEALEAYGMPDYGPLFLNRSGQRVTPGDVSHQLGVYLRSQGISGGGHRTRHGFATAVYRSSLDLLLTQNLLGHKSPATTSIYAMADARKAAGVVGALKIGA